MSGLFYVVGFAGLTRNPPTSEEYNKKNKKVRKSTRRDKRKFANRLAADAQQGAQENGMKTVHDTARRL